MKAGLIAALIIAGVAVLVVGHTDGSDIAGGILIACAAILAMATINDGGKPPGGDSW